MRQPDVGRAHAVDADVVRAAARAVDVEHERPRRVGRHRVRLRRRSESGQDAEHVLIVPVEGYRQIHQLPRLQLGSHLGAVRLEHRRIGRDGDVLADLPDLHRGVDSCDVVQRYRDVLAGEGAEAGQLDRHGVRPGLDRRKPIGAIRVGHRLVRGAGLAVCDRDGGSGHGATAAIRDVADHGTIEHLCRERCRSCEQDQRGDATDCGGPRIAEDAGQRTRERHGWLSSRTTSKRPLGDAAGAGLLVREPTENSFCRT